MREMHEAIRAVFAGLPQYRYEHIFIDNASRDGTARILRALAAEDLNVKVILNARNFGHVRSGYYALLQAKGDAVTVEAKDTAAIRSNALGGAFQFDDYNVIVDYAGDVFFRL